MTITAAADGSALGNPGPAGWAWYVDDSNWGAGGWKHATNNQGELKAVLELFRATAHLDDDLLILCDSQYVINSITKWMKGWKAKGWRKGDGKPVMNLDLLTEIDEALAGRRYRFEWVKGHVGHPLNEAADIRARTAAEAFQRGRAPVEGPGYTRGGGATPASTRAPVAARRALSPATDAPPTRAAAPVTRAPAPASATAAAPQHPGLFEVDGSTFGESNAAATTVTLTLSALELTRLQQRAARAGLGIDAYLRSLI
jgi:ribonuclease HI